MVDSLVLTNQDIYFSGLRGRGFLDEIDYKFEKIISEWLVFLKKGSEGE
jgi:hypothetical protein